MIVVHHLNNSRSQRVLWMLEELGVPYELQCYERDPQTMLAPASLKKVHPLGKSPVITDGDTTMAESGAILEYLVDTYGKQKFSPAPGTPERRRYTYWMHYAEGSLMPVLLLKLIFDTLERGKAVPIFIRPIARLMAQKVRGRLVTQQLLDHLGYMEAALAQTPWFAGNEFSAADIQMSYPVEAAAARGGLDSRYSKLTAYLQQIRARPAYLRAIARGGPYEHLS